jgi:hypothetical protein
VHNFAVIGVWRLEADGSPAFGDDVLRIIVHEFTHSYVNPWVDEGMQTLRPAGEALIRARQAEFERTGYGQGAEFNPDVLYETITRTLVILYLSDTAGGEEARRQPERDSSRGWVWLPAVVGRLRSARSAGPLRLDDPLLRAFADVLSSEARKP